MTKLYQLIAQTCIDGDENKFNNILRLLCNVNIKNLNNTQHDTNIPKCSICFENNSNIVIIPCGHVCSCSKCSNNIFFCPVCRGYCIRKQPLYFC
jgi:hypothetical protein